MCPQPVMIPTLFTRKASAKWSLITMPDDESFLKKKTPKEKEEMVGVPFTRMAQTVTYNHA